MPVVGQELLVAVVIAEIEPGNTGMVIAVIDPTDADCKADRVTSTASGVPAERDELTWLKSVTGSPGFIEVPVTGTSGI